jgi:hypothetical protein
LFGIFLRVFASLHTIPSFLLVSLAWFNAALGWHYGLHRTRCTNLGITCQKVLNRRAELGMGIADWKKVERRRRGSFGIRCVYSGEKLLCRAADEVSYGTALRLPKRLCHECKLAQMFTIRTQHKSIA